MGRFMGAAKTSIGKWLRGDKKEKAAHQEKDWTQSSEVGYEEDHGSNHETPGFEYSIITWHIIRTFTRLPHSYISSLHYSDRNPQQHIFEHFLSSTALMHHQTPPSF